MQYAQLNNKFTLAVISYLYKIKDFFFEKMYLI